MAKLYFYYAAMDAGKSTSLLQSNHNYRERGMDTLLLLPATVSRTREGEIESRIGLTAQATPFPTDLDVVGHVRASLATDAPLRCVLVDEAQFLTKGQVEKLCEVVDELKVPVLAYGLRTDFQGELFEGSRYLLAWAEEIAELKTMCFCGKKATMNMRVDAEGNKLVEGPQVQIGGNESYVATCRKHHLAGKSAAN